MNEVKTTGEPPYPTPLRTVGLFCSFAVPGLGQIVQGVARNDGTRLSKGLFLFVSLNAMFFYGMWLGDGRNVYLPHQYEQSVDEGKPTRIFGWEPPVLLNNMVLIRLQYAGQFWAGLPAWPAIWNYYVPDVPVMTQYYDSPGSIGLRHLQPATWAPLFAPFVPKDANSAEEDREPLTEEQKKDPVLKQLADDWRNVRQDVLQQRDQYEVSRRNEPDQLATQWATMRKHLRGLHLSKSEQQLNRMQLAPEMGKFWDIAWVYTVIAGVLNILVIYDAWAGPIRLRPNPPSTGQEKRPTS